MGNTCQQIHCGEHTQASILSEIRRRDLSTVDFSEEQIRKSTGLLSSISHPNIIAVRECAIRDNTLSVFEQYNSQSLQYLSGDQRKNLDSTLCAIGLTAGLYYLHKQKRLPHECLCPANIYFRGAVPVIAGVLDCWDSQGRACRQEVTYYSAPETLDGCYGQASDVWSLGLILLEIAIARPLRVQLMSPLQPCKMPNFPPDSLLSKIKSEKIRSLVRRMLNAQPSGRITLSQIKSTWQKDSPPTATEICDKLYQMLQVWFSHRMRHSHYIKKCQEFTHEVEKEFNLNNPKAIFLYSEMFIHSNRRNRKALERILALAKKDASLVMPHYIQLEPDKLAGRAAMEQWAKTKQPFRLYLLAQYYARGRYGFEINATKALEILMEIDEADRIQLGGQYFITNLRAQTQGLPLYDLQLFEDYRIAANGGDIHGVDLMGECLLYSAREFKKSLQLLLIAANSQSESLRLERASNLKFHIEYNYRAMGDRLMQRRRLKSIVATGSRKEKLRALGNIHL